ARTKHHWRGWNWYGYDRDGLAGNWADFIFVKTQKCQRVQNNWKTYQSSQQSRPRTPCPSTRLASLGSSEQLLNLHDQLKQMRPEYSQPHNDLFSPILMQT
ncbi:hypothetical protein FKM82_017656, partial [Ascaphus truei]